MENDWDFTLYVVADRLHMPIYKLKDEMSLREFIGWIRYIQGPKSKPIDLNNASQDELARLFG